MARIAEQRLSQFLFDTVPDTGIKLIQADFGLKGFAIVVKLLQETHRELGYYCEWNDEVNSLFAFENGVKGGFVSEIVKACIKRGIFDEGMYDKYNILTSRKIQENFLRAKSRSKIKIENRFCLIKNEAESDNCEQENNSVTEKAINVTEKAINVTFIPRREEKGREEKKSEVKKREKLAAVVQAYEANIGKITAIVGERIEAWLEEVDASLLLYAIEQAVSNNVTTWKYVDAIVTNHFKAGRKTREAAEGSKGSRAIKDSGYVPDELAAKERAMRLARRKESEE